MEFAPNRKVGVYIVTVVVLNFADELRRGQTGAETPYMRQQRLENDVNRAIAAFQRACRASAGAGHCVGYPVWYLDDGYAECRIEFQLPSTDPRIREKQINDYVGQSIYHNEYTSKRTERALEPIALKRSQDEINDLVQRLRVQMGTLGFTNYAVTSQQLRDVTFQITPNLIGRKVRVTASEVGSVHVIRMEAWW